MTTASILIVGDEILQGHTQDTNSHYVAVRLEARGIATRRILTVPDDIDEIASALETLLGMHPDFIFVCGGIGPTPDDRTYEAVAMAVGSPLVVAPADEAWMRRRMEERGYGHGLLEDPAQAEALWRMIRRPEGSRVVLNPVGAALGSAIRSGPSTVFVLPGVPRELRAMVEHEIEPAYLPGPDEGRVRQELEFIGEEARTYAVLREAEARFPSLQIGSYPQDERGRILLRIQGRRADVDAGVAFLEPRLPGPVRRRREPNKS